MTRKKVMSEFQREHPKAANADAEAPRPMTPGRIQRTSAQGGPVPSTGSVSFPSAARRDGDADGAWEMDAGLRAAMGLGAELDHESAACTAAVQHRSTTDSAGARTTDDVQQAAAAGTVS